MLRLKDLGYVLLNKTLKLISPVFAFFNMALRKFKVTFVDCISIQFRPRVDDNDDVNDHDGS